MELYKQHEIINIICVKATSFPDGIMAAFEKLEGTVPNVMQRIFFGLSKPEGGQIVYKAGVQEKEEDEVEKFGFERFTLEKGTYLTETIEDWKGKEFLIGQTFEKLLQDPRLDHTAYCIEWYGEKEVKCMVKLVSE